MVQPFHNALGIGGTDPAVFIAGGGNGTEPAGVQAGDYVLTIGEGETFQTFVGGVATNTWALLTSGADPSTGVVAYVHGRRLDAVDVANLDWRASGSGSGWAGVAFRGPTEAAYKTTGNTTGTSIDPPDYTPTPGRHQGTVVLSFFDGGSHAPVGNASHRPAGYDAAFATGLSASGVSAMHRLDGLDNGAIGSFTVFAGGFITFTFELLA